MNPNIGMWGFVAIAQTWWRGGSRRTKQDRLGGSSNSRHSCEFDDDVDDVEPRAKLNSMFVVYKRTFQSTRQHGVVKLGQWFTALLREYYPEIIVSTPPPLLLHRSTYGP